MSSNQQRDLSVSPYKSPVFYECMAYVLAGCARHQQAIRVHTLRATLCACVLRLKEHMGVPQSSIAAFEESRVNLNHGRRS